MKKIKKHGVDKFPIVLCIWMLIYITIGVLVTQSHNGGKSSEKGSNRPPIYGLLIENRLLVDEPFLVARPKVVYTFDIVHQYETFTVIETEYIGEYFVTAYCPEECGWSWSTSSGATCHYSDDPIVPTTCAIDRSYHGYGEILMIDGKLYVTEDTGPGVKGRWVDCFVETMDDVRSWPTGWKSVYAVTMVEYDVHHARFEIN